MKSTSDYGEEFASAYDKGRSLPDRAVADWMTELDAYLGGRRGLSIVDVGAGTGRFAYPLANWFEATVYAIEPSEKMRAETTGKTCARGEVVVLDGNAAALPINDASTDAAFLSMVIHHIPDLKAAATELARVLKPSAHVYIRAAFSGRLEEVPWYTWFPEAKEVDEKRLPSVNFVKEAFAAAGFEFVSLKGVPQILAENFDDFVDKIGTRAISTQKLISDEEFHAGMARMRAAASTVDRAAPIVEPIDLLVLRLGHTA